MLTLVPTPIGNLEDISLRALKALDQAAVVFCEDTRVAKKLYSLLSHHLSNEITRQFIPLHSHNEYQQLQSIDNTVFEKACIYLTDAGMPGISDPGALLVRHCQEHGIEYDVLPGANAALTALVMSGLCEKSFYFYGFLPHKGKERQSALHHVLYSGKPTILYESPHRIAKLFEEIAAIEPTITLFAAKELTKQFQRTFQGSAESVLKQSETANLKGEWVVIIESKEEVRASDSLLPTVKALDIPKKAKAKLIASITGRSVSDCYNDLVES